VLLDDCDAQAELAGADAGDVAARTAAEDDHVAIEVSGDGGGRRAGSRCRRRRRRGRRGGGGGRGPPRPGARRRGRGRRRGRRGGGGGGGGGTGGGRGGGLVARLADPADDLVHRHRRPGGVHDLEQHTRRRAGDLGVDLVGGDLEQRLIALDPVADLGQPLG